MFLSFFPRLVLQDKGQLFKLKEDGLRLVIRRKFFVMRVVRHRHGLPKRSCGSWEVFKARWDGVLSKLV